MYALMVTPNKFPNGDAGAVRDEAFSKIYMELGYDVCHIGCGVNSQKGIYNGIKYWSIYQESKSFFDKLKRWKGKNKVLQKTLELIESEYGRPNVLHIYDIGSGGINWAVKLAVKYNIPIVHDSVEWYSPCQFRGGRLAYPYILKNIVNKYVIKRPIRVIAISTYLESYYRNKGIVTARIPVIMDSFDYKPQKKCVDYINIVYAGSPGVKDYLRECIQAFCSLSASQREKFRFNIFGVDNKFYEDNLNISIPSQIINHGRVSRTEVLECLSSADFSILLRPTGERYANAGFPTKSVEALMNGCGMICNLTSDLGLYLVDNNNAILVKDCSVDAMQEALVRISNMKTSEIEHIKLNARTTAQTFFDYRKYTEVLSELIQ